MSEPQQPARSKLFDFDIWDIWPILRKQKNIVFLFLGTVLTATIVGAILTPKEYEAVAMVHLTPRNGQEIKVHEVVDMNSVGYYEVMQFYRTQVHIVDSRTVREKAARAYQELAAKRSTQVEGEDDWKDLDPEGVEGGRRLAKMLLVVTKEQSQLINIQITDTNPERAAELANLVAKVYAERNLDLRRDSATNASDWLKKEIAKTQRRLDASAAAVLAFKTTHGVADIEEKDNALKSIVRALDAKLGEVTTRRLLAQNNLETYRGLVGSKNYEELARVMDSPALIQLLKDRAISLQEQADVQATYGPKHPRAESVRAKLSSIEGAIRLEVDRNIQAQDALVKVATHEESSLNEKLAQLNTTLLERQQLEEEYRVLKLDFDRAQAMYEKLNDRSDEVELVSQTQLNNVFMVDPAVPPRGHVRPNIPVSIVIAILVGLFGGFALALLREYIDDTISSHLDVAAYLNVNFLGFVPAMPPGISGRDADLFVHNEPRSSVAEAVRGLRAMLDMAPDGEPPRRLLVTSSVAREGKTSIVTALAVSYAQTGRKVVIVDADLRRPRVHKVFAAENRVGLTNYLLGTAQLDDLLRGTEIPGVYAIYAGSDTDHPAELLASKATGRLVEELQSRFDIVLFDTPPSVALSDAVSLSPYVDGTVLVVRENSVSRHVVRRTVETFTQVNARILGVVLNAVDINKGGASYKYYYAYRNHYYYYAPGERDDAGPKA